MLLLPISLIYAFGVLVGNSREAWVLIGALLLIFVVMLSVGLAAESSNQALSNFAVNQSSGNLEGKEIRFGVGGSDDIHRNNNFYRDGISEQHVRQLYSHRRISSAEFAHA